MAGEQNNKVREHWVVAATLLGYTIVYDRWFSTPNVVVVLPDGKSYLSSIHPDKLRIFGMTRISRFKSKWQAARAALQHAGLNPNDIRPNRAPRINPSSVPEIFERRNEQARVSYRATKMRGKRK